MSKTHIDVSISVDSIRDSLRKKIVSEHSALMTKIIIGHLIKTDVGLEQLYKAMSGIDDTTKYKVGDIVLVNLDIVSAWKLDKNKSADLIRQNRIKGLIISIDPFSKYPYSINIPAIDSMGVTITIASTANDKYVCLEDEWPGDDLPF